MAMDRESIIRILREHGLKATKQRLLLLEVLADCPHKHLTVEEIYEKVKEVCPQMGLATVYRTMQLFLELHLIDRINLDDGYIRYEIGKLDGEEKHHHHHLICLNCGKVLSFEDDLLEDLEDKITKTMGFKIVDHEVKLYGYCVDCGGKLIEKKRKN